MAKQRLKYLVLMCTLRYGVNIVGLPEVVELYSVWIPKEEIGNQNQRFHKQGLFKPKFHS